MGKTAETYSLPSLGPCPQSLLLASEIQVALLTKQKNNNSKGVSWIFSGFPNHPGKKSAHSRRARQGFHLI